jgi:hypothetical protein
MTKKEEEVVVHPVETSDDEVEAYWTKERMAGAKPLPFPVVEAEPEEVQEPPEEEEPVTEEPMGPDGDAPTEDDEEGQDEGE